VFKSITINNKNTFYFWAAAAFACMLVIFLFSAQPAEQSSEISESLIRVIVGTGWGWFAPAGQSAPEALLGVSEVILRKSAHLFVFFVLGFCTASAVKQLTGDRRRVFWVSFFWCSLYGAVDEVHQYFVPGRACMWQDWLIDTAGAFLGVGLVVALARRVGGQIIS